MKCPNCKTPIKDAGRIKGGKQRWKGISKKRRSEEMKHVRQGAAYEFLDCISSNQGKISLPVTRNFDS